MEDENEVIQAESPQAVDPQQELNELFSNSGDVLDSSAASKAYNLPGFGDSQYDKDIKIDAQLELNELFNKSLEQNRALLQPKIDKFGNALGRLTNIIPEAIGGMAAVLDFEDYFNSNDEVGNWLTDLTNEWKESTNEALPIYRTDRDKPMDFGDSGWWFENGSSLVQSIGGFAITGGAVAKGLQGLSKLAKLQKIGTAMAGANVTNKAGQVAQTLGTAVGLNQAEAILEASEVYKEIYEKKLTEFQIDGSLSKEEAEAKARQKAADAASITVETNRLNILLNITSASLFTAAPRLTRNLLKRQTTAKNLGYGLLEGGQESAEEVINYIASQRGKAFGNDKEYGMKDIYFDIISDQSKEAALLGFMGGLGQTIITKEGVNRINKTVDPETGDKISVRAYNKLAYKRQKEQLDELEQAANSEDVKSFTDIYNSVEKQAIINQELEKAIKDGNDDKVKVLQKLSLDTQALNAFKSGTTEPLIKLYEDLANGPQKKGMDKDYAQTARKAVERIESLENIYNQVSNEVNSNQLYHNRSLVDNYENEMDRKVVILNNKKAELAKQESRLEDYTTDEDTRKKHRLYMRSINPLRSEIRDIQESIDNDSEIISFLNEQYKVINSSKYKKNYKQKQEESNAQEVEEELDEVSDNVEEAYNKEQDDIANEEATEVTKEAIKNEKEEADDVKAAKRESNNAFTALNNLIDDSDTYNFEPIPNSPGVIFKGGSDLHLELLSNIKGFENVDANTPIIIQQTREGLEVSIQNSDGTTQNFIVEEYNIVEEDTSSNDVVDSQEYANNNDNQLDLSDNPIISKTFSEQEEVKLNKAKDASLVVSQDPQFSSSNYKEFSENPRNKVGEEVKFSLGYPENSVTAKDALSLLQSLMEGSIKISDKDLKKLIRQIPIKVNFNEDTFTHLPFESEMSSTSLTDAELEVKTNLITQILLNQSFDGITSKVKFQYPGIVKQDVVDGKPASNNILDLEFINNNISNVEYFISDSNGNILSLDNKPNASFGRSSFPGNIFVKVKTANGKDFPLKVNIRRVNELESDLLLVLTEALLNPSKKLKFKDVIGNKQDEIVLSEEQLELLKQEAKILGKSVKNLTIIDLISSLVYEGTSDKNKFKISGVNLTYGNNIISFQDFESSKGIIKNWLINNKNRNVKKANLKEKAYKEYITKNVLSTDAKLGEHIFGGNTKIYIDTKVDNTENKNNDLPITSEIIIDDDKGIASGKASDFDNLLASTPVDDSVTPTKSIPKPKSIESIPNPVARKKAKGKIKGGLKAKLRAKKNNNNSNVNDIPSTDDKNKKC